MKPLSNNVNMFQQLCAPDNPLTRLINSPPK